MKNTTSIILRVALPTKLRQLLDYLPPTSPQAVCWQPGMRVKVPFKNKALIGVLIESAKKSSVPLNKLRQAHELLDQESLIPKSLISLCEWAANYYHYPLGEVIASALPAALRLGKPALISKENKGELNTQPEPPLALNDEQAHAVAAINQAIDYQAFLLDGITGSGKTEVYLQVIAKMLQDNKQVLVLVPEIGLTPQTLERFQKRFAVPVVAIHSGLTSKQRLEAWVKIKTGRAGVVIGTRSAVFSVFANLGLVIVDEEHDISFKQQDGFRYHARDLAIVRAQAEKIPIILGSATPSLETLRNAKQGKYHHLVLNKRAGIARNALIKLIDTRRLNLVEGLSTVLIDHLKAHLGEGNQVMLFLNRRGYAPVLMCHQCGWMAQCGRCDARLTYHQDPLCLRCHHCDKKLNMLHTCKACNAKGLTIVGLGTERIESALAKLFPDFPIARVDRDSTQRKGQMEKMLAGIQKGDYKILIGTQMLAKGHHFPNVTLVAVIDADGGFFSADFRATERSGQLLLQVAGRAGREEKAGVVVLQTHQPDHPLLKQLLEEGYASFASTLLKEREHAMLPPYTFFALFRAEAHAAEQAILFLEEVKRIAQQASANILICGPVPAPLPKRAGRYRVQLLLQAKNRLHLQRYLQALLPNVDTLGSKKRVRWSLDIDPLEMY